MSRLTVLGRLEAAEGRRLRGLLVPYGEPGHTNLGTVRVRPGGVEFPLTPEEASRLFAHLDHQDGREDVARWVGVTEDAVGLWAEWDALETHGGDRLLAEYRAGKRTGVSMELEPVAIDADGYATGTLVGNAFPERPAFSSARLVAELAPGAMPTEVPSTGTLVPAYCVHADGSSHPAPQGSDGLYGLCETAATAPAPEAEATPTSEETPSEETPAGPTGTTTTEGTPMPGAPTLAASAAVTPASLLTPGGPAPAAPAGITPAATPSRLTAANAQPADVYRLLAGLADPTAPASERQRLMAALVDIVPGDMLGRDQPAWIGELWSGVAYQRRVVPLLNRKDLTSLKVRGWRWVTKPTMAKYAGNKAPIPSTAGDTEEYNEAAQRFAGGNDVDRAYEDFKDAEFFAALHAAYAESYARLTDLYAVEKMKAAATPSTLGSVPAGVPIGWVATVDAALDVIDVGTPTFALVEKSVYRDMLLTGQDKFLEFLNAGIGFEEGTLNGGNFKIIPVSSTAVGDASSVTGLDVGEVMVGTKSAVTFRELGGGTPIRSRALDIVNGGVDEAAFGYAHVDVEDDRGLRIIDTNPDGA